MREFNEKIALWTVEHVGTMACAWLFLAIGVGSLIGVLTGNTTLALVFGAVSSYILQLVLLPIIMVGQSLQNNRHDEHADALRDHGEKLDKIIEYHEMYQSNLNDSNK